MSERDIGPYEGLALLIIVCVLIRIAVWVLKFIGHNFGSPNGLLE